MFWQEWPRDRPCWTAPLQEYDRRDLRFHLRATGAYVMVARGRMEESLLPPLNRLTFSEVPAVREAAKALAVRFGARKAPLRELSWRAIVPPDGGSRSPAERAREKDPEQR